MLSRAHRRRGDGRVHVIGRRDDHRVEVALLGEHLAEVDVLGRLLEFVAEARRSVRSASGAGRSPPMTLRFHEGGIDVAERDEILARHASRALPLPCPPTPTIAMLSSALGACSPFRRARALGTIVGKIVRR